MKPQEHTDILLAVRKVSMRFGRNRLFRDLTFDLKGGESIAITGPNGSGKSTLLRILTGVLAPDAGEIELQIGENRIDAADRALNTGLVAPYLNVYDMLSARENLAFLARARLHRDADGRIDELLALVGLGKRGDDLVGTFSSGMKQRVKFAAAVLSEPAVLLLDEPSSNLDEAGISMLNRVMSEWLERSRLLVVATNDPREAERCHHTVSVSDFQNWSRTP